ncbi:Ski complex RNA helicase Ski2 [Schizosaccharomyces osmophilus]|uniref:Ski complex RNA helicase Ski2 n=1 Tax=Schizosaccharomyces osmophilus TaxID=2545709 RepID=A0AAE9WGA2_9SCHI|nr:Ski complex RNA helicase Ski2 [Schizosaccharomyces osmophilus]WBW75114.1 Ski complex RNA helicase Ski2 [Schizosaccharomyces osmophilus]
MSENLINSIHACSKLKHVRENLNTTKCTSEGNFASSLDLNHESETFLRPAKSFSHEWVKKLQKQWENEVDPNVLFNFPKSVSRTNLQFRRQGLEGHIIDYKEISEDVADLNAKNSSSFLRKPASKSEFVRGSTNNIPFLTDDPDNPQDIAAPKPVQMALKGEDGLYQVPPGFSRGLVMNKSVEGNNLNDEFNPDTWETKQVRPSMQKFSTLNELNEHLKSINSKHTEIDDLLPDKSTIVALPSSSGNVSKRKEYAHVVDSNATINNFHQLVPEMALDFPFELDNFQKEAVYHLEMGDSVFVAAHTSAGKTVVAEYAIALAQKHMTKAIYTSPIKALSNQKFRDFKQKFEDVGILTGDVQVNPEASCLIMTTEILRSMLYRGADLIRDVEFVVFDEVHYVNDLERGVVWEEVIIMLPPHITVILLSATVPNTKEFASWVGRTKKKNIYVISTSKRPVPLEHYLWVKNNVHKVVDQHGRFLMDGYKSASDALKKPDKILPPSNNNNARGRGGAPRDRGAQVNLMRGRGNVKSVERRDANTWVHLAGHLQKNKLLPVIIFVFSKKRCEEYVDTLSNRDLNNHQEKSEVHIVIEKAVARLKKEDRTLPQIGRMREMLSRGLAVHHGGLLPIVKEIVELLFQRGLVKILFATETFAMGVNMPARSVVFSGVQKHDGRSFRELLPGEYTQCSGRAGRRGLDVTGTVIILSRAELPDTASLRHMILGPSTKLISQFRLTYNMVLNLLRVETLRIEDMIKRSFSENANQSLMPQHEAEIKSNEEKLSILKKELNDIDIQKMKECIYHSEDFKAYTRKLHLKAISTATGRRVFRDGRLIVYQQPDNTRSIGVLLGTATRTTTADCTLEVAYLTPQNAMKRPSDLLPFAEPFMGVIDGSLFESQFKFGLVSLSSVERVCTTVLRIDCGGVRDRRGGAFRRLGDQLASVKGFNDPVFDEADWSKVKDFDFCEAQEKRTFVGQKLLSYEPLLQNNFVTQYALCFQEYDLENNIRNLREFISDQNLELLPDYEQRIRVLQELQYVDENKTVLLKGRVACEINSTSELVLTELILENTLGEFSCEETIALLSAFVFDEKTDVEPNISSHLQAGKDMILQVAERVNRIQEKHQVLYFNEGNDFESQPRFGLMEVCYEWARGMSFNRITDLTDILEGSIVRTIIRLDEVLRECRGAARVVGDASMYSKMEECQNLIRRNIVFCPSLYM